MKKLLYKQITTIEEAKTIWDELNPNVELFDNWEFRYLYYQFSTPPLYFYAGYDGEELVGVLPLQWNETLGYLEFFGGQFMSYNSIYVKPGYEAYRPDFLTQIDKPAYLRWMRTPVEHAKLSESTASTYYMDLKGISTLDEYFQKYVGKTTGKQIRKEMRNIMKLDPVLSEDKFEDFDTLVKYNKEKFGESSVFHSAFRQEFFQEIFKHFDCHMLSLRINNELQAVGLRIKYNNVLYGINTGVKSGTSNLGKLLYLKAIEYCIDNKIEKYDALEGAYGWKEAFGFLSRPQYHLDLR